MPLRLVGKSVNRKLDNNPAPKGKFIISAFSLAPASRKKQLCTLELLTAKTMNTNGETKA